MVVRIYALKQSLNPIRNQDKYKLGFMPLVFAVVICMDIMLLRSNLVRHAEAGMNWWAWYRQHQKT